MMPNAGYNSQALAPRRAINAARIPQAANARPVLQQQQQQQQQQASRPPTALEGAASWVRDHAGFLEELVRTTGDEGVKLQLKRFVELVAEAAGPADRPARGVLFNRARYVGQARKDAVLLRCTLSVTAVVDGEWTVSQLFTTAVAVTSSKVSRPDETSPSPSAAVGVVGDWYCLIASAAGEYSVEMDLLVPYSSARKTGVQLSVPKAAHNELAFTVPSKDVFVKVDPSLFTAVEAAEGDTATVARCLMPPSPSLSINWTEKIAGTGAAAESAAKAKEKVVASVEQHTLLSIGEGYLLAWTKLKYTVTSGQMSVYVIELDPRVRVLNVEGLKNIPVRSWEVEKQPGRPSIFYPDADGGAPVTATGEKLPAQVLLVHLEYGLEDSYEITIVSELPLDSAPSLRMPCIACVAECEAHHISKEKGFVAIEARTNVEIREGENKNVGRIDTSELPEVLWSTATNPPLLGYRFLSFASVSFPPFRPSAHPPLPKTRQIRTLS